MGEEGATDPANAGTQESFRTYQVSELLPFIPPAISAESGIPMEKLVAIPVPPNGSSDVSLSTIYRVVPELFAAEITPLNDSKVTLPVKLEELQPTQPNGGGIPGEAVGAFSAPACPPMDATPACADADNPFWSPYSDSSVATENFSAQSSAPAAAVQDTPTQASFQTAFAGPEQGESNPFAEFENIMPGRQDVEVTLPEGYDEPEAKDQDEGRGDPVGLGVSEGNSGGDAGSGAVNFGAGNNPFADFSAPADMPDPQPATNAESPVGLTPFDSDARFSTLFSKQAEEDSDIPFPDSDGENGNTGEEGDSWGAMFDSDLAAEVWEATEEPAPSADQQEPGFAAAGFKQGFGNMIDQSGNANVADAAPAETKEASPRPQEQPSTMAPEQGSPAVFDLVPSGFQNDGETAPVSFPEPQPQPEPTLNDNAMPGPITSPPEPTPEAKPVVTGFSTFPDFPPAEEKATSEAPRDVWSDDDAKAPDPNFQIDELGISVSEEKESESNPEPFTDPVPKAGDSEKEADFQVETVSPVNDEMLEMGAMQEDADISLRDLELRAIFSTDENFTLSTVAQKVVGLEGVEGCALATKTKLVQASKTEQSRLGSEAREMIGTIRNLAKLTGLPEARSFTLHTDRGTVSIFLEGDCCVTVNHSSSEFRPGVKEKLILIARSIHKLED
jgi:hypothetical protein